MINEARGSHVSPGVYTKEVDATFAPKSMGITSLGLAGETLKGPAFQPISINDWAEFKDYFGGTSAKKFVNSIDEQQVKYELPYVAKEYLKESKRLTVTRILGLSGYDAGDAFGIIATVKTEGASGASVTTTSAQDTKTGTEEAKSKSVKNKPATLGAPDGEAYVVGILRSKGRFNEFNDSDICGENQSGDTFTAYVTNITSEPTVAKAYKTVCSSGELTEVSAQTDSRDLDITLTTKNGSMVIQASLNKAKKNNIVKVFGTSPIEGTSKIYVEEFYEDAVEALINDINEFNNDKENKGAKKSVEFSVKKLTGGDFSYSNYKTGFECANTPWFVSEARGEGTKLDVKKLFKVYTISDGDAANTQVKISITNILPEEGLFDLRVRDYNDTDANPVYLEQFVKCSMNPKSENFIGLKIGTIDGEYELKSKYIMIEIGKGDDIENSVPCGFLGYPMRTYVNAKPIGVPYNKYVNKDIRTRKQFFGISNLTGYDSDAFKFKGVDNSDADKVKLTKGFHLDERLSHTGITTTVDGAEVGEDKYINKFETVSSKGFKSMGAAIINTESVMNGNLYADKSLRKFTVLAYGGFDGWDVRRKQRTNTDNFTVNKYGGVSYVDEGYEYPSGVILPERRNNSDFYAYLAGYLTFNNPEETDINIFATPGIDWKNNTLLVKEALDIIEDPEYGRGGDALYIVNTPEGLKDYDEVSEISEQLVEELKNTDIDSSYIGTYWPWVKCYDSVDKSYVDLPVTKDIVRNMAYVDNNSYPWMAPAGVTEKGYVDCVRAAFNTRCNDEDTLYDGFINPVKTFAVDGVKIWGNKTIYSVNSPLNRVNVRRLMIRIKKEISKACRPLIFEQNDMTVRSEFLSLVTPILEDIRSNRGITDFKIQVDNSVEAIDEHVLPAKIWIKPTPTLEYIDLTFIITPQGGSFLD